MKTKILLAVSLAWFIHGLSWSQQQSVYTNILSNPLHYSPAYVGSTNYHQVSFFNRTQWAGFKDAPRNFYLNFHGSYKNKAKHGYGVILSSESIGIVSKTSVYLNYGYQIKFNPKWRLGLGIRPGFMNYRMRIYEAVIADQGDYIFTGNNYSGNAMDVSTGFRLYTNKFEVSGSFDHMIGKKFDVKSYNQNFQWHYSLMTSYKFQIKNDWVLQPAVTMRYTAHIPLQLSALFQVTYKNQFVFGANFRAQDAFGAYVSWRYKDRLAVSYGYDYSYTSIRKYNAGSHEIGISFILTKNRPSLAEEDDKLNNSILEDVKKEMEKNK